MSRTRIVKGISTKITTKNHFVYSRGAIENNSAGKLSQKGANGGVKYGKAEFPDLVYEEDKEYKLSSDYALQHLQALAKDMSEMTFILFMLGVFGNEIEVSALGKLFRDLCDNKLNAPDIIITKERIKGGKASYSNKRKKVLIFKGFLLAAIEDNNIRAELMSALVEELGHHIDNLLRTDYATNAIPDTDVIDEGAKFAYALLVIDFEKISTFEFATFEIPDNQGSLKLDMTSEAIVFKKFVDETRWNTVYSGDKDLEKFGFGFTAGTHGGIELKVLAKDEMFVRSEVYKIYYGNWLRDVSQVIMPDTIRFTKEVSAKVEKYKNKHRSNSNYLKVTNTIRFSHDTWVKLIEFFAAKEFSDEKEGIETTNYVPHLENFRRTYGQLTKDMLGVYRPEEHIDNPKGLGPVDEAIRKEVNIKREVPGGTENVTFYAGEKAASFQINEFGQKHYIYAEGAKGKPIQKEILKTTGGDYPSADLYLSNQLKLAVQKGRNKEGFRHLGAALHVVEDYFSHTNFVELSLRKIGQAKNSPYPDLAKVYPWVQNKEKEDYKKIPIVTGNFLLDDTFASVLPKMGEMLFPIGIGKYEQKKAGERTFMQQTIYVILKDLSVAQKDNSAEYNEKYSGMDSVQMFELYESLLKLQDWMTEQKENKYYGWALIFIDKMSFYIGEIIKNFCNILFNLVIGNADLEIKEGQTLLTNKNYGEDPTHTQLGKDSERHPLNSLGAEMAMVAVEDIGRRIMDIWNGKVTDTTGQNLSNYVLNIYSRHPKDVNWMEPTILKWLREKKEIKGYLEQLNYPTLGHYHDHVTRRETKGAVNKIKELYEYASKIAN